MKKVLMALALMVFLSVLASAENDSVTTGPYKISFDTGFARHDYSVNITPPKKTEELDGTKYVEYEINITNKIETQESPQRAYVTLTRYDKEMIFPTIDALINPGGTKRQIDGVDGVIFVSELTNTRGITIPIYTVLYYPAVEPTHLRCIISSFYPWDSGTLQLLKTIHIEKIKS